LLKEYSYINPEIWWVSGGKRKGQIRERKRQLRERVEKEKD